MIELPTTLEARLALALDAITAPQKRRILKHVHFNPNIFTHEIAQACAVGFPPNRIGELNKEILPRYGLYLRCCKPEQWLVNRHGETSYVHQWRLETTENIFTEAKEKAGQSPQTASLDSTPHERDMNHDAV